jgi:hypothetical protein
MRGWARRGWLARLTGGLAVLLLIMLCLGANNQGCSDPLNVSVFGGATPDPALQRLLDPAAVLAQAGRVTNVARYFEGTATWTETSVFFKSKCSIDGNAWLQVFPAEGAYDRMINRERVLFVVRTAGNMIGGENGSPCLRNDEGETYEMSSRGDMLAMPTGTDISTARETASLWHCGKGPWPTRAIGGPFASAGKATMPVYTQAYETAGRNGSAIVDISCDYTSTGAFTDHNGRRISGTLREVVRPSIDFGPSY